MLSVCWAGHKHFIVQTTAEGLYRFEGPAFPTVQELIAHQLDGSLPVTTKSGAILKKAVPRETWELNNDDVELVEKIGSVIISFFFYCFLSNLKSISSVRIPTFSQSSFSTF